MDWCVYESDRFGSGSVMVWTGICRDAPTQLTIVQGTLNAYHWDFTARTNQPLDKGLWDVTQLL
jgi:hypothetical protein